MSGDLRAAETQLYATGGKKSRLEKRRSAGWAPCQEPAGRSRRRAPASKGLAPPCRIPAAERAGVLVRQEGPCAVPGRGTPPRPPLCFALWTQPAPASSSQLQPTSLDTKVSLRKTHTKRAQPRELASWVRTASFYSSRNETLVDEASFKWGWDPGWYSGLPT